MLNRIVSLAVIASILSGCAASTVLERPKRKDLDAINAGVPRGLVLAELGAPISTHDSNGETEDVFAFDKGVAGPVKFGRAFFHIAADICTLTLWELVGWPAEKVASGVNTKMDVTYDKDGKVKTVAYLKR